MQLANRRILVVGLGRSGQAALDSLSRRGALLTAYDAKQAEHIDAGLLDALHKRGITVYCGAYPKVNRGYFDLLVASPGISLQIQPFVEARASGIPIIGEMELAYQLKSPALEILAVTGTNGKTTTTALLQHIFSCDGREAVAGGNIGVPFTYIVDRLPAGVVVLEASSFQLETVADFKPHICGFLNVTPDHLDRHENIETYIKAKTGIFVNQTQEDFSVMNYDDAIVRHAALDCSGTVVFFSKQCRLEQGIFVDHAHIVVAWKGKMEPVCPLQEVRLRGNHNLENMLCAVGMAYLAEVGPESIRKGLATFHGVRHRMEEVIVLHGVAYVNDSKATNPESVIKALESFHQPVVLIAGGRNKGSDFTALAEVIKARVKALVLLGEAREEIAQAVMGAGFRNIYEVDDLAQAVSQAAALAETGDTVLLSPACASWDMFQDYEERGDLFCRLVRERVSCDTIAP